jgi:hypothetical protein
MVFPVKDTQTWKNAATMEGWSPLHSNGAV